MIIILDDNEKEIKDLLKTRLNKVYGTGMYYNNQNIEEKIKETDQILKTDKKIDPLIGGQVYQVLVKDTIDNSIVNEYYPIFAKYFKEWYIYDPFSLLHKEIVIDKEINNFEVIKWKLIDNKWD